MLGSIHFNQSGHQLCSDTYPYEIYEMIECSLGDSRSWVPYLDHNEHST